MIWNLICLVYYTCISGISCCICCDRACDGTVRIWSLPNSNHQYLQHTCVFEKGEDRRDEEINGSQISNLVWSANGKLIAASSDNIINIWALAGTLHHKTMLSLCPVKLSCFECWSFMHKMSSSIILSFLCSCKITLVVLYSDDICHVTLYNILWDCCKPWLLFDYLLYR